MSAFDIHIYTHTHTKTYLIHTWLKMLEGTLDIIEYKDNSAQ